MKLGVFMGWRHGLKHLSVPRIANHKTFFEKFKNSDAPWECWEQGRGVKRDLVPFFDCQDEWSPHVTGIHRTTAEDRGPHASSLQKGNLEFWLMSGS
jgi:hypothetical protein